MSDLSFVPGESSPIPQDQVSLGDIGGAGTWAKFGYRDGLTAAAGEETVWSTTGNFAVQTVADTYDVVYNSGTDGSGTTGALVILIDYLDENHKPQQATHVLGNTGRDTTAFQGWGINRVVVVSSGTQNYNTNEIYLETTAGASKQAAQAATDSVTHQAIYHVPINHSGIVNMFWFGCLKLSGGSSPSVEIRGYVYNHLVQTRFLVFRSKIDTSVENHFEIYDPIGFKLGGRDVLYFVADTDTNNTDHRVHLR